MKAGQDGRGWDRSVEHGGIYLGERDTGGPGHELVGRTYVPLPARKQEIPKDGGKVRVLSIPVSGTEETTAACADFLVERDGLEPEVSLAVLPKTQRSFRSAGHRQPWRLRV